MKRQWLSAALGLLLAAPAGGAGVLLAQDRDVRVFSFGPDRGRIGVMVDMRADADRDKIGARIQSVVPDSPAQRAGLQAGDIITSFNGTKLGGLTGEDRDVSGPGEKLVELARALDPGDKASVEYRRGSETKKATIEAEELGNTFSFRMPDMDRLRWHMDELRDLPERFEFFGRSRWGGLEMVSLNPDLGEYFGAKEGLLVVSVAENSEVALKAGDVILSIAGRTPSSPSHAMRILHSYEPGEAVDIGIMRKQRRQSISYTVPEGPQRRWRSMDPGRRERPRVRVERS